MQVSRTPLATAALGAVALSIVGEAYRGAESAMAQEAAALGAFPHSLDDAMSVQVLFGQCQQDVKHDGLQTQVTFDFALFPSFECASDLRCHRTGGTRDEARYRNPPSRSSPYPLMARVGSGSFPSKSEGRP